MLAFLIKASVAALRKFPDVNASLDGDNLVLKQYFHIGFAADTPNGLVVPVIRNADQKGVLAIASEMSTLSAKAREGKLGPADMQGGCFSISSLGGIGGTAFTPIINAPEVAILGVSKSATKPVWTEWLCRGCCCRHSPTIIAIDGARRRASPPPRGAACRPAPGDALPHCFQGGHG